MNKTETTNNKAINLCKKGDFVGAEIGFRLAIEENPDNGDYHSNLGACLYIQRKWFEAMESFEKAIKLNPNKAGYHYNLGICDRFLLAEDDGFRRAIKLDPTNAKYYNALWIHLYCHQEINEAEMCCQKAISLDPTNACYHNNLGYTYLEQNKTREAVSCFLKAIKLDPTEQCYYDSFLKYVDILNKLDNGIK